MQQRRRRESASVQECGVFISCQSEMKYINEHVRLVLVNWLHQLTAAHMQLILQRDHSFCLTPNIGCEGRKPVRGVWLQNGENC